MATFDNIGYVIIKDTDDYRVSPEYLALTKRYVDACEFNDMSIAYNDYETIIKNSVWTIKNKQSNLYQHSHIIVWNNKAAANTMLKEYLKACPEIAKGFDLYVMKVNMDFFERNGHPIRL